MIEEISFICSMTDETLYQYLLERRPSRTASMPHAPLRHALAVVSNSFHVVQCQLAE